MAEELPQLPISKQEMLSLLLERTEQGFWFIDNQLRTTDANPAMCRMLRTTRAEMLGRTIYDYVDEANAAIFREHVVLRSRGVADGYRIALRRSDGTLVDCFNNATPVFDDSGRKVGAIGLFSDIGAQAHAEHALREARDALSAKSQVLERTLESLSQGVLSIGVDGRINACNARVAELIGVPPQLLRPPAAFADVLQWQLEAGHFEGEVRDRTVQLIEMMRTRVGPPGKLGLLREAYLRETHQGRLLSVESHLAADGAVVRTFTDITERVRGERALVAAKEEAERANAAKSLFLSRMSHELRTPLNAILGFGQLLQTDSDHPLSPLQQQRLQELLRGGRHLLALINEVLDLSRIEAGAIEITLAPVALAPLVAECLSLVLPMASARGVRLASAVDGARGAAVQADAVRLRQVLLNLLANAIKYGGDAGLVSVAATVENGHVRLAVSDQGPGIPEHQQQRLFQAFERLDAQHSGIEGAGIGLALSKRLMALMQGEIGVSSTVGEGSTFWLRLPRVELPQGPRAAVGAELPAVPQSERRQVLYIEDNAVNQLLMHGMLSHRPGIELSTASHPEEGLALAAAKAFDLVLLDIQLPYMDGFEVLRRLRQLPHAAHTPVVALSANAMNSDIAQARAAGIEHYLTKPLDMGQLLAMLDQLLQGPGRDDAGA